MELHEALQLASEHTGVNSILFRFTKKRKRREQREKKLPKKKRGPKDLKNLDLVDAEPTMRNALREGNPWYRSGHKIAHGVRSARKSKTLTPRP